MVEESSSKHARDVWAAVCARAWLLLVQAHAHVHSIILSFLELCAAVSLASSCAHACLVVGEQWLVL